MQYQHHAMVIQIKAQESFEPKKNEAVILNGVEWMFKYNIYYA